MINLEAAISAIATTMMICFVSGSTSIGTNAQWLGTNLGGLSYWTTAAPLKNLIKVSTINYSDTPPGNGIWKVVPNGQWQAIGNVSLNLDKNGYARSIPSGYSIALNVANTLYCNYNPVDDKYLVLNFKGNGIISYGYGTERVTNLSTPGRDVIAITMENGYWQFELVIHWTDPTNYLRNFSLTTLKNEANVESEPFNPAYLDVIKDFGTYRFMDWLYTNGNPIQNWNESVAEEDIFYNSTAPLSLVVKLLNQTKKNGWINIPHLATDDYVFQFATYMRDHLDPSLKIYVEYTNEAWNGGFSQSQYMSKMGKKLNISLPGDPSDFGYTIAYYAYRRYQIMKIWNSVFKEKYKRLVCVYGGWGVNGYWVHHGILTTKRYFPNSTSTFVDAISLAPYFGYDITGPQIDRWVMGSNSPNFLPSAFDNIFAAIDLREIYHQMKMNAILCRIYNATCVAYEAGQSLLYTPTPYSDNNQTLFLAAANRDPRMGKLYVQYFEFWFKAMGPSLALHYTDIGITSKWGYWGSLNDIRNTSSPKRDALQSILQSSWNSTTFNKQVTRTQVMSPHRTTTTTTTTNYVVPSPSILPLASKLNWLGTNLAGLSYWTTAAPLKNMLKVSIINYSTIPFGNGIWTVFPFEEWEAVSDVILDLDQNGYAKYVPIGYYISLSVFNEKESNYNSVVDKYLVLNYDGEGTMEYGPGTQVDEFQSSPGRDIIKLTTSSPYDRFQILIYDTDPSNYLRNFSLTTLKNEANVESEPFNPAYLDVIKDFGTYRFMDWLYTNGNPIQNWNAVETLLRH